VCELQGPVDGKLWWGNVGRRGRHLVKARVTGGLCGSMGRHAVKPASPVIATSEIQASKPGRVGLDARDSGPLANSTAALSPSQPALDEPGELDRGQPGVLFGLVQRTWEKQSSRPRGGVRVMVAWELKNFGSERRPSTVAPPRRVPSAGPDRRHASFNQGNDTHNPAPRGKARPRAGKNGSQVMLPKYGLLF